MKISKFLTSFLIPTSYFLLPTSYLLLLTSYFLLLTSYLLLLTSYLVLPPSLALLLRSSIKMSYLTHFIPQFRPQHTLTLNQQL
jgi:hypothetical protein